VAIIGKDLLKPSDSRKPFYTGFDTRGISYSYDCLSCGSAIETQIMVLGNSRSNVPIDLIQLFKEHFGIGISGKTRDGGWPAFQIVACPTCGHQYVVLTGVKESSNSFDVITIQGICEIL
jgi:DNA-directed RNA polymerase subunit RPC12/RpoP